MAEITIKSVKVSQIKLNPDNPRTITGAGLDKLIKSIRDFPEMMELREIVVDETMTVLGGNMRLLALQKSGAKNCIAKIVKGLTDEQKREFIIKDNAAFGEWDFGALADTWDDLPLIEWGINLPKDWLKEQIDESDNGLVPDKDPNILVRLSFHAGLWLGKHEEIKTILDKMATTYNCTVKVEE